MTQKKLLNALKYMILLDKKTSKKVTFNYILSGTEIPNKYIEFLITSPTFFERASLNLIKSSSGAFKIGVF